jgi:arylsulfatase A-like enzyme
MFRWSLLFLAICLMSGRPAESADQPNIVLLLADDLGWKDVGFHDSEIETPHLDRLAAGGTRMTQFYVQPVCSPTRGALLTGKYPCRLGLQCGVVRPWAEHGLPVDERTLPQALSEGGYFTAICGKWHLGHATPEQLPLARGFAHQYGHYNGALDYFTHLRDGGLDWHRNQEGLEEEGYTTTLIGAEAVRLIEAHDFGKRPMFLYVPFNAPHSPLQAPEEYLSRYESIRNKKRRTFAAMVTCMDDAIGSIVAALSQAGQTDNTLILFCSDNGGPRGLGGDNGLLRAGKGTLYEGGVRVPAVAHWPNVVPAGGKVDGLMHIVDLYPTLLAVAALTPGSQFEIDGVNQWPVIMGERPSVRHEVLLNTTPFHGAVRLGPWKLIHNGRVTANATSVEGEATYELFNLKDDPYEKQDLSESRPDKLDKLKQRLQEFADSAVEPNIPPNKAPEDFQVPKVW